MPYHYDVPESSSFCPNMSPDHFCASTDVPSSPELEANIGPPANVAPLAIRVTLTSIKDCTDRRNLTLVPGVPFAIGRASRSKEKNLEASPTNALFDCPVVSRQHAELRAHAWAPREDQVSIVDYGSMHGTRVNEVLLKRGQSMSLRSGDVIQFGEKVTRGEGIISTYWNMWVDHSAANKYDIDTHDGVMVTFDREPPISNMQGSQTFRAYDSAYVKRGFSVPYASGEDESPSDDGYSNLSEDEHEHEHKSSSQTTPEQAKAPLGSAEKPIDLDDTTGPVPFSPIINLDDDDDEEMPPPPPPRTTTTLGGRPVTEYPIQRPRIYDSQKVVQDSVDQEESIYYPPSFGRISNGSNMFDGDANASYRERGLADALDDKAAGSGSDNESESNDENDDVEYDNGDEYEEEERSEDERDLHVPGDYHSEAESPYDISDAEEDEDDEPLQYSLRREPSLELGSPRISQPPRISTPKDNAHGVSFGSDFSSPYATAPAPLKTYSSQNRDAYDNFTSSATKTAASLQSPAAAQAEFNHLLGIPPPEPLSSYRPNLSGQQLPGASTIFDRTEPVTDTYVPPAPPRYSPFNNFSSTSTAFQDGGASIFRPSRWDVGPSQRSKASGESASLFPQPNHYPHREGYNPYPFPVHYTAPPPPQEALRLDHNAPFGFQHNWDDVPASGPWDSWGPTLSPLQKDTAQKAAEVAVEKSFSKSGTVPNKISIPELIDDEESLAEEREQMPEETKATPPPATAIAGAKRKAKEMSRSSSSSSASSASSTGQDATLNATISRIPPEIADDPTALMDYLNSDNEPQAARRRKTGNEATDFVPIAAPAPTSAKTPAGRNRVAEAAKVAGGALLGGVATMAFLCSPLAERALEWLA